jgi:hypothetical protein
MYDSSEGATDFAYVLLQYERRFGSEKSYGEVGYRVRFTFSTIL